MPLSNLPTELICQILSALEPASFYSCLQTSKLLRSNALSSTKLLRMQLSRLPGLDKLAEDTKKDASALMRIFGRRAALHLAHHVDKTADGHVWRTSRADRKLSKFVSWDAGGGRVVYFLAVCDAATVHVYAMRKMPDGGHSPKLQYVVSSHTLAHLLEPNNQSAEVAVSIVQVAAVAGNTCGSGKELRLAVLYRTHTDPGHQPRSLTLVCYRMEPDFGPTITEVQHVEQPFRSTVVGMCFLDPEKPIIAWRMHRTSRHESYRATSYMTLRGQGSEGPRVQLLSLILDLEGRDVMDCVTGMRVQGDSLHFYPSMIPMPQWTVHWTTTNAEGRFRRRDNSLPGEAVMFARPALGRTIATHHHHLVHNEELDGDGPVCFNTALELAIAREETSARLPETRGGAYLMKAIHCANGCETWDPDEDYQDLQHVFVAKLNVHSLLDNISTTGIKYAVSPRARRIAIANWQTLYVFALDPHAFLDPANAGPIQAEWPDDVAYVEDCGWQYYINNRFCRECVVLEPVELPCSGVVFDLEWKDEDELWGWSDVGLFTWRLGPRTMGRRGAGRLEGAE